jgi:predicted nucleic acid-binding protein
MRVLIDTNILLRTVEPAHPQHAQATRATDSLRREGNELCLVPQNIYEFWVVATRPRDVNGLGMTTIESEAAVSEFLHLFTFLRDERAIFEHWYELVVQNGIYGVKAHDARLAAAMRRHGIS